MLIKNYINITMNFNNLPKNITKIAKFEKISDDLNKLFEKPELFQELLEYTLEYKYPANPSRKRQVVLDYVKCEVYNEVERTKEDEKGAAYMTKFNKDYLAYQMNSIISEEKEMRLTTWDLPVIDNFFENTLKENRYGFLPLTLHSRDTPNSNQHYLLIILDYQTEKFYLFDSRNSNDYLYRSKYLPSHALDQLMIGLTQYKPFAAPFQYIPMDEWLGAQLQTVVHRNKWDSIYSLAWCLLIANWLNSDESATPETVMVELNNSDIELDKQNFIHEYIKNLLYQYRSSTVESESEPEIPEEPEQAASKCNLM
jgi:hypothetical protein